MTEVECACPWRDSETPCHDHSHYRASKAGEFYCVMHEHTTSTPEIEQ